MTTVSLYGGAIKAKGIGSFLSGGQPFTVIRPGYCIQGNRRDSWTQVVHEDVPIFEVKTSASLEDVMRRFDFAWETYIGPDKAVAAKALDACKKARRTRFRDGVTAEPLAPSVTQHGLGEGLIYKS